MAKDQRKTFRVEYTDQQQPVLRMGNREWKVIESTKQTIRIDELGQTRLSLVDTIHGTLHHPDGTIYSVKGQVERREGNETILVVQKRLRTAVINRRDLFRILYPPSDRLSMTIEGETYAVTEMSEKGLRFQRKANDDRRIGSILTGEITMREGDCITVQGEVFREEPEEYILQLTEGIPLNRVVAEQKYLIQKYRESS